LRKHFSQPDAGTTVKNDPSTEQANLRDLTRMVQFAHSDGAGFLLVFVPFRRVIAQGVTSSVPNALKDWAANEGVDLIDLTSSVSSFETNAVTLRGGAHFNVRGNRLLADSLEGHLADKCHN
jgi:hypothetical protein